MHYRYYDGDGATDEAVHICSVLKNPVNGSQMDKDAIKMRKYGKPCGPTGVLWKAPQTVSLRHPRTEMLADPFMAETEIAKLRAEIERLRAALQEIAEMRGHWIRASEVARRALEGK